MSVILYKNAHLFTGFWEPGAISDIFASLMAIISFQRCDLLD